MEIFNYPNWNGLVYGKETCLVSLQGKYLKNEEEFQRWVAIYDVPKKIQAFGQAPKIRDSRFDFLNMERGRLVVVEFESNIVDLDEENAEIDILSLHYFPDFKSVSDWLEKEAIALDSFQLSWKSEYPLGV